MLNRQIGMVIELSKLNTRQHNLRTEHQVNRMVDNADDIEKEVENNEKNINNLINNLSDHEGANNPHSESQRKNGGPTEERPDSPEDYEFYFDTDLGQPIWYNGTEWVDYEGNTL